MGIYDKAVKLVEKMYKQDKIKPKFKELNPDMVEKFGKKKSKKSNRVSKTTKPKKTTKKNKKDKIDSKTYPENVKLYGVMYVKRKTGDSPDNFRYERADGKGIDGQLG